MLYDQTHWLWSLEDQRPKSPRNPEYHKDVIIYFYGLLTFLENKNLFIPFWVILVTDKCRLAHIFFDKTAKIINVSERILNLVYSDYNDVQGICKCRCTVQNTSHSCSADQKELWITYLLLSHLCTSSPCLPLTGQGSCDWPTAGLWSNSLDCSDLRRQTCMFAVLCHSTRARRQIAPQTHRAGLCSPPEQSHLPGPAQLAGPCRKGGSPWAQTSVSDMKSLSHPVGQCFAV